MTVTTPRLPAYQPTKSERARERRAALLAALAVLLLVVGVPTGLLLAVGSPVPTSLPTRETLTGEISPMAVVRVLSVVVWAAWLHFVVSLVLEYRAERAGRAPTAAGPSRALARRLVATLVLLSGTAGQAAPALAHEPAPRPAAVAPVEAPKPAEAAPKPATNVERDAAKPKVFYEVQPRQDLGHHDTLWGIAERFLGDGFRYKEIAELNLGRPQPDGRRLEKPDLIRPGWVLELPPDAKGEGLRVVAPAGVATRAKPAPRGSTAGDTADPVADVADAHDGIGMEALGGLGGAGLLAAGVLAMLRKRRGPYGAEPDADTAAAEVALRLAADEAGAAFVDRALRALAHAQQASGDPLPEVYAAALDADGLLLHAAPAPTTPPPTPWRAEGDGWYVRRADAATLDPGPPAAAPYPGLVSFGRDQNATVLLDLEAAPGIVSVGGADRVAREVAVSVAVELATNVWSDDVRVTMVGFGDDLSALAPGRLRQVPTLDQALDDVTARQRDDDEVLRGRLARRDRWTPEFVVLSAPPSAAEVERILPLVSDGRRPVAVVAVGDVPAARWRFVAGDDGTLDTGVLGLTLDAQRLRVEHYAPLLDLFGATERANRQAPRVDLRALNDAAPRPVAPHHLDTARPADVEVRLLGPVGVSAPGPVDEARRPLLTEVVTYLALHEDGAHPAALAAAVWPRGVSDEVRDATLAHVQAWLGTDAGGRPRAYVDADGRWRLSAAEVRCDWHVFRALATAPDEVRLARALGLVRGPALSALPPGRYAWLARSGLEREITVTVVAAAHAAVEEAIKRGGEADAVVHAWAGLMLAPRAELLWRDLLRFAQRRKDREAAVGIVEAMWEAIGGHPVRDATAAETDALIAELLPGYRPAA